MLFDYLLISIRNLRRRGIRTWLTMLGIFIGIASVVSLISLGQGLKVSIDEQFQEMGTDKVFVMSGNSGDIATAMLGSSNSLTEIEEEIVSKVKGVKIATSSQYGSSSIVFKDETKYGMVIGYKTDETRRLFESMSNFEVEEGRHLKPNDKFKIVVGSEHWKGKIFSEEVDIGNTMIINSQPFKVIGKVAPIGNPQDDAQIYIPFDTYNELFDKGNEVGFIMAQVQEGEVVAEIADDIERALRKFRNVKEGEEDFSVSTSDEMLESVSVILDAVTAVFAGIAAISLVVGGIGIMNTMYTSVMERTTEVGVMKAIGARNSHILTIFLIESGLLGVAGGIIGITLGYLISKGVEIVTTQALGVEYLIAYFPNYLIFGALGFAFIVGAISGVLPAYQASKLNPVDSLRYE